MKKKVKVLIIAEACNPEWTSVPLVGWSHANALMRHKYIEAHLVTQIRNRDALKRSGLSDGIEFTSIDSEFVTAPIYRLASFLRGGMGKGWTTLTALTSIAYPFFELLVWRKFKARIKAGEYDVVHRITPLSPTAPSLISVKCKKHGIPFIMGPLNGGVPWPREYNEERHKEKEWLSYIRGVYTFLPGIRSTRRDAKAIVVASKATYQEIPEIYKSKCVYIPENAVDPERFPELEKTKSNCSSRELRAAFVGRLVPYKGVDMLLKAAEDILANGQLTLDIYGDGPERNNLEQIVKQQNLQNTVKFHGFVGHDVLHQLLSEANILTFPSIREFGGAVVLEAMAVGVVPIVVDYGGPGELVVKETGYKIPIGNRESIIHELKSLLQELIHNRSSLDSMSQCGKQRVKQLFTWDAKANQMYEVYLWAMGENLSKPSFDM